MRAISKQSLYPAALHLDTWKPINGYPINHDGVDCCIHVTELGRSKIRVELIPEDECEDDCWPVDVLKLSKKQQAAILKELHAG